MTAPLANGTRALMFRDPQEIAQAFNPLSAELPHLTSLSRSGLCHTPPFTANYELRSLPYSNEASLRERFMTKLTTGRVCRYFSAASPGCLGRWAAECLPCRTLPQREAREPLLAYEQLVDQFFLVRCAAQAGTHDQLGNFGSFLAPSCSAAAFRDGRDPAFFRPCF